MTDLWLAYYSDWSEFAVFATEVEALRYAVSHTMSVEGIGYGVGIREQVNGA